MKSNLDRTNSVKRPNYRIAVVGAGARGETFARQLYAGLPRATLFGVCDVDAERLEAFCGYCGLDGTPRFTSTAQLFREPDLDAVVITTPEFTHADVAIDAMRAGKHIYLEKAMAESSAACRRIIAAHKASEVTAYMGFNARAFPAYQKLKEILDAGTLGQIVHISGLEQLRFDHGAAFMRRFHRHSARSGGLLNTKCAHDLDILQWLIGHRHKIVRVASFGGSNVFTPDKQPAKHCSVCPIQVQCPYRDTAGFVFPVGGDEPIHHPQTEVYGGDLCVYDPDKDLVDNQTVILEWDHGVRGSFNLQMFQAVGRRRVCVWGEDGYAELNTHPAISIRVTRSRTGDVEDYSFTDRSGGHGGTDPQMMELFVAAMDIRDAGTSGLAAGLAATLVAESADNARKQCRTIQIEADAF